MKEKEFFYYTVDFSYCPAFPETEEAVDDHDRAYQNATDVIEALGWEYKHCYSYPDGSLYLFLRCPESSSEKVESQLQKKSKTEQGPYAEPHPSDYMTHQGKLISDLWI